jgi:hypothetical protein
LSILEAVEFHGFGWMKVAEAASVAVLSSKYFGWCQSLSSVKFESGSRMLGIEMEVFGQPGWFDRRC